VPFRRVNRNGCHLGGQYVWVPFRGDQSVWVPFRGVNPNRFHLGVPCGGCRLGVHI